MSDEPLVRDLPVGIGASGHRRESDSMGVIDVPADRYWGAQTQRSLLHFGDIGGDPMPLAVYHAFGHVKKAAALANGAAGRLPAWMASLIARVCDEVIDGELDEHFPLRVWQTGSGTQSNMNVNEVIANRCIQLVGGVIGSKSPVHPNDHVNMGQSSNDTFPTAMHVAAVQVVTESVIPSVTALRDAIGEKAVLWRDVVKIGRTHLEDAVPLTVGQEWSGYARQLTAALSGLERSCADLYELAVGGTAVGTGLNAPPGFAEEVADRIAASTGYPFVTAPNKFAALGGRRRRRGRLRRAARARRAAGEDRQRHPLARVRAAGRARGADPARQRARVVDHAGQGEPDPVRGAADGVRAGARQRRDHRLRRLAGEPGAEHDAAGDHRQLPALGLAARRGVPGVPGVLRRGRGS